MTYHEVDGESEIWGYLLRWRKGRHRERELLGGDGKFEGVDGGREEGDDVAKML